MTKDTPKPAARATRAQPPASPAKAAVSAAARPAEKAGAKPTRKTAAPIKAAKVKKPKMVRDSFTIPKDEYGVIDTLKQRCAQLQQPAKKSELLRAGIKALAALGDKQLLAALQAVPSIKTGRPRKA